MDLSLYKKKEKTFLRQDLFLNSYENKYKITAYSYPSLGIVGRISLVFSKRGLDVATFGFQEEKNGIKKIKLVFWCDQKQFLLVFNDLHKIVDLNYINYTKIVSV